MVVYDSVLNMCVIGNTAGICHLQTMLILPYASDYYLYTVATNELHKFVSL